MIKGKNQNIKNDVGKKVEEVVRGTQDIIANGTEVQQEDGNNTLSPEQQAIDKMGAKTKKGVSAIVGEGEKLIKDAVKHRDEEKEIPDTRESQTKGTAPESSSPVEPREPVHSQPIESPSSPEEFSLSSLDSYDNPKMYQEAGLNQMSGNLHENPGDISNRSNMRRSEGVPESVQSFPPRQAPEGIPEPHALEDNGLDLRQEIEPEILPDGVDLENTQIAHRYADIEVKTEENVSTYEVPKSETGSADKLSTPTPEKPKHQERRYGPGNRERNIRPTDRHQDGKSQPQAPREKQDGNNRMSVRARQVDESSLKIGGGSPLKTSENTAATYGIQAQNAPLSTMAEGGGQAVKTMGQEAGQAVGQTVGQAGTSAAAGAASGGTTVAVQVGKKVIEKIAETVQTAVQTVKESPQTVSGIAAIFFIPILAVAMFVGSLSAGGGSASNVNLSEGVLELMPKIIAACQEYDIPEYAPLVAAVMMQESGGNVELVNGDVMMCAEAMGYPVFTPVPVDESIRFGTSLIAGLLKQAGVQGPDDLTNIKLALQSYNYGPGYMSWVKENHSGVYSKENAVEFANMMATQMGWSGYGDEDYVDHVLRYYRVDSFGTLTGDSVIESGFFAYPCSGHPWDTYSGHEGIDISWSNCFGEPIYAVADGVVTYTHDGWTPAEGKDGIRSYGNTVWVTHGNGWQSRYGHMSSVAVESGTYVTQGQVLGYIGNTGNSFGAHLHLALYDSSGNPFSGGRNWAEVAWPQHGG